MEGVDVSTWGRMAYFARILPHPGADGLHVTVFGVGLATVNPQTTSFIMLNHRMKVASTGGVTRIGIGTCLLMMVII